MQTCNLYNMAGELTTEKKLNKLLEEGASRPSNAPPTKPLIRRVTHTLRARYDEKESNRYYFEPISVAIGPLHHERGPNKSSRFEIAEECKLQLAAMFIKYGGSGERKEDFYNNVKEEIDSLRKCYDPKEVENWNDEELAWMFLVDRCALLQFIFLDVKNKWEEFDGKNDRVAFAKLDILLLENQLPYRLLEILIDSCTRVPIKGGEANPQKELKDCITEFISKSFLSPFEQQPLQTQDDSPNHTPQEQPQQHQIQVDPPQEQPQQHQIQVDPPQEPAHLLELLRKRLINVKSEKEDNGKQDIWRHISQRKGVERKGYCFKAREKRSGVITKIDFNYRYFCIPTLTLAPILVDDTTMPKLLNLIAYEMCPDLKNEYEITSYVSFLDSLIDSGEDVKELRDAGVLHNALGSDQAVAELFNKIGENLVPNLEMYTGLKYRIQKYCNRRWAKDAQIWHTYFRSPWSIIVFVGAFAGLVMTGMHTIFLLLSVQSV
ncbi:hypothetical protein SLEP1_g48410 [Rubroshorea leprosula]|uniref:Uncharacterized protein n=1 Tax=Rubroshorea leprosula TaxID=152421 RepID=A0AAV5LVG6_9ROSI|nr:hypothetical protein SLEP1_g48410 [Rubroshorea leprosula]